MEKDELLDLDCCELITTLRIEMHKDCMQVISCMKRVLLSNGFCEKLCKRFSTKMEDKYAYFPSIEPILLNPLDSLNKISKEFIAIIKKQNKKITRNTYNLYKQKSRVIALRFIYKLLIQESLIE